MQRSSDPLTDRGFSGESPSQVSTPGSYFRGETVNINTATYQPLARKELKAFFEPYRRAFPDWQVEHDVALTRKQDPLRQVIFFEGLRYAAYRPAHSIQLLINIPDGCGLLHQYLDVKNREVERGQHATKWPKVLKAMEEQFEPLIRRPLDVAETLVIAEEAASRDRIENINYLTGLAALNAYLGNAERARYWCGRVENRAASLGRALADWETRKRHFVSELLQAMTTGEERDFLSRS